MNVTLPKKFNMNFCIAHSKGKIHNPGLLFSNSDTEMAPFSLLFSFCRLPSYQ